MGDTTGSGGDAPVILTAPAKLTLSLRVVGVRDDGYHLLESEMVTLDLADLLVVDAGFQDGSAAADRLDVVPAWPGGAEGWRDLDVGATEDNLVTRALAAVDRSAQVTLVKRIPPGAGLGGGSADAAALLRWAGCTDRAVAARLGADVPFCLDGGRAKVTGIGEVVEPLPYEARSFVLVLPPFGVDTAAVYRAWDALAASGELPPAGSTTNDLEAAATEVEPRLIGWRRTLEEATGRQAHLAGSGSSWFVDGVAEELGIDVGAGLLHEGQHAPLIAARTTPAEERGAAVAKGHG
jgi:4-diphosphocytidyl-2-C-methyl-D-erythritol kinase